MAKSGTEKFFAYARERHAIHLRRAAGEKEPWTEDPILARGRFCCVFREDDKTTAWFRNNVRDSTSLSAVLLATVVFRMFNRITTGEAIFCQLEMDPSRATAFDEFFETGDTRPMRRAITQFVGKRGPFVTGAYIIAGPRGYSKLDGVLKVLKTFYDEKREMVGLGAGILDTMGWRECSEVLEHSGDVVGLEMTWSWLRQFPYLGKFHSYEIVTDLRHTGLLSKAPDVMTWASVGPGARRGANRVHGRPHKTKTSTKQVTEEMRELLEASGSRSYWPHKTGWPKWELRDVEHTLCEWDKYERVRLGQGRLKGRFR